MKCIPTLLLALLLTACQEAKTSAGRPLAQPEPVSIVNKSGETLATRFNPPEGYRRAAVPKSGFGYYLRNVALKPYGAMVHYYDGREKANPNIYAAVLTLDVGSKDLQQCADAVMRLRAEYLLANNRASDIAFKLTNGFNADYQHWMQGYRVKVNGTQTSWVKSGSPANDYTTFRNYLDFVYNYAGTLSLSKALKPVAYKDMQIGDVFIIGGSPGHAITVMDMAQDAKGNSVYLLSQSYMPAQDIQILENPNNKNISPWYELDASMYEVNTPQWEFRPDQLKRFP